MLPQRRVRRRQSERNGRLRDRRDSGEANDPEPPRVTSGLRLGTPSITTRGFKEEESRKVADLIVRVLNHRGDEKIAAEVSDEVGALTSRLPVPGLEE